MLAGALKADIAAAVQRHQALLAQEKGRLSATIAGRYSDRYAAILREIPERQHAAAVACLAQEQAEELAQAILAATRTAKAAQKHEIAAIRAGRRTRNRVTAIQQLHQRTVLAIEEPYTMLRIPVRIFPYHAVPKRLRATLFNRHRHRIGRPFDPPPRRR